MNKHEKRLGEIAKRLGTPRSSSTAPDLLVRLIAASMAAVRHPAQFDGLRLAASVDEEFRRELRTAGLEFDVNAACALDALRADAFAWAKTCAEVLLVDSRRLEHENE